MLKKLFLILTLLGSNLVAGSDTPNLDDLIAKVRAKTDECSRFVSGKYAQYSADPDSIVRDARWAGEECLGAAKDGAKFVSDKYKEYKAEREAQRPENRDFTKLNSMCELRKKVRHFLSVSSNSKNTESVSTVNRDDKIEIHYSYYMQKDPVFVLLQKDAGSVKSDICKTVTERFTALFDVKDYEEEVDRVLFNSDTFNSGKVKGTLIEASKDRVIVTVFAIDEHDKGKTKKYTKIFDR